MPPIKRAARGSVMILVVALLGLLAVIGTVYIVASRTSRASANAMTADENFGLARDAMLSDITRVMSDSMIDANNAVGGVASTGVRKASRNYDYPELGATFGQTDINASMRDEPWLAKKIHPQTPADICLFTPTPFNPSTGTYSGITNTLFPYSTSTDATVRALSTVVGDQTTTDTAAYSDDPPTALSDAYINLTPFSDGSGIRYRWGARVIDTNRMANVNTGAVDDAVAKGDTTGSYLSSMRLAPVNADMNYAQDTYFNVGTGNSNGDGSNATDIASLQQSLPNNNGAGLGRAGSSTANGTFSLAGWQQQVLRIENPSDNQIALYDLSEELELRSYGEFGTGYHSRIATGTSGSDNNRAWPYTFTNTATLAGVLSPGGSVVVGNPRRRNYTTYSEDRRFRPYVDPASLAVPVPDYVLVPVSGANASSPLTVPSPYSVDAATSVCETYPGNRLQQVYVNYPISFSSAASANDSMFYMAATATNMATLMESACSPPPVAIVQTSDGNPNHPNVYTHAEAVAFAANYMMYRDDGMVIDTTSAFPNGATPYFLPAGPSFIDNQGICVRSAGNATTLYGRDFGLSSVGTKPNLTTVGLATSNSTNIICLGYAAQPFLNEVAAQEGVDNSGATPVTVIKDAGIELHNPYLVALSLKGFHIKVFPSTGGNTPNADIDLTGQYIPAQGYLVILATGGSEFSTKVTASATVVVYTPAAFTPASLDPLGGNIVLYRPYLARNTMTQQLAPIDQFNYNTLVATAGLPDLASQQPTDLSIARINSASATVSQWGAAYDTVQARANATLGAPNNNGTAGTILYDRFAMTATPTTQGAAFVNINEFNQIMRLATFFDATDPANPAIPTPPANVPNALIPDKLPALATTAATAPYASMDFPVDAQIHFDFLAPPYIYSTTPSSYPNPLPASAPMKSGDIRAVHLLDQISFIDRVADTTISASSLGYTRDIDKLRIPGRININTASGDVLRAIPAIQNITSVSPNQAVANILAYRDRLASGVAKYPAGTGTGNSVDYSDHLTAASKYPGLGFRSMAELLDVLAVPGAADLQSRDKDWAATYNLCTVRSDTFVVYGYMEAVRANPVYTGAFDNAQSWYGTVTDDPHDATAPLLRVAQRRWVAIIDRSLCNYDVGSNTFTLPKVVAIKDLPQ